MARSSLPQSPADWFAATFTVATVIILLWAITSVPQQARGASLAAAGTADTRHAYRCEQVPASAVADCLSVQFETEEEAVARRTEDTGLST